MLYLKSMVYVDSSISINFCRNIISQMYQNLKDPENSVTGQGGGSDNVCSLTINVFHRHRTNNT